MTEITSYATFPPAAYASSTPTSEMLASTNPSSQSPASTADHHAMRRSFDAATSQVKRQPQPPPNPASPSQSPYSSPSQNQNSQMGGEGRQGGAGQSGPSGSNDYADVYAAAGATSFANGSVYGRGAGAGTLASGSGGAGAGSLGGMIGFGAPGGANIAPFIPQAQALAAAAMMQQTASQQSNPASVYSVPGSPYANLGSPSLLHQYGSPHSQSNGQLPSQGQSYNGSTYSPQFDTTPSSPNPYASPNPYSQGNPYAAAAALGYMGLFPGMMGMGMMSAMGSPTLANSLQLQQQAGYPLPYSLGTQNGLGVSGMNGAMNISTAQTGRTVYVGNLPSDASVDELLSQVRFGPIDSVKIIPEKSCAFISFLDPHTAAAFHSDALMRKVRLHEQDLKIGWGKPSAVPPAIVMAVQQSGATRNVYLGNLDESMTEQSLRDDLSRFGPIDQVKIVRDRAIAFVHFLSIATAIKVVQSLASEPEWAGRRVNFGKDRCAYVPKNQHQQQQHNLTAAAMGSLAYANYGAMSPYSPSFGFGENGNMSPTLDGASQIGNRTIYLGNIHPETTTEEICNTIRGGILQQIRYIPDKHICFITFVDPGCALAFYQHSLQGLNLHNRRLKTGWGKNSGPTPPGIAMVVQAGGSRNVYIGNIEDFETFNEERLRKDFGEYGDIELVNSLPTKNASFVNFTNIANAIKAIEGMKQHPDYAKFRISYGKDRCGGAPKHGFDRSRGAPFNNSTNTFPTENGLGLSTPLAESFDSSVVAAADYPAEPIEAGSSLSFIQEGEESSSTS